MVRPFRAQSALWTGTQGVALGARNAPLGLNTTAHRYCTGRFLVAQVADCDAALGRELGLLVERFGYSALRQVVSQGEP